MERVCLHMIVKNESANIERCLAAAAPHIDAYMICDTGSTDRTVEIIRRFFDDRGLPGEIAHTTFTNFGQARNEALARAHASTLEYDYLLLCDADMELRADNAGYRERLTAPAHTLRQRSLDGTLEYVNIRLVRRDVPARYVGVAHEYLDAGGTRGVYLPDMWYLDHACGSNRPGKFERNIRLLSEGLRAEPGNTRYAFYLAESYFDNGNIELARDAYAARASMGGWSEEVFYSHYHMAICSGMLGREAEMIAGLLDTFERFPHRAEPLHRLALHYQRKNMHRLAYHFADIGAKIRKPIEGLFVEADVYEWRLADILAVSLYYIGRPAEGKAINRRLLQVVPESQRPRVFKNLQFCEQKE